MEKSFSGQIDLPSLLRDVLRQWFVILLATAGAVMLAYVLVSIRYVPQYTTSATFIVTNRGTSSSIYNNLSSAKETATRFTQVLESNVLKKAVMEELGLDSFDATTSAKQVGSTNMVELKVTSESAVNSYQIMKSILENYSEVTDYIVGSVILEIIKQPSMPVTPTNTLNRKTWMIRAGVGMAGLLILLMGWLSYSRDSIKNENQFRAKVDAKPLGVIYHERKSDKKHVTRIGYFFEILGGILFRGHASKKSAKVSMLITNPMRSFFFVESNKMAASRVRSRMDSAEAKVCLVTSVMENEGKSTVAANIAMGIAQEGKKVLLIDADLRKPSQYKIFQLDDEVDMKINLVNYMRDSKIEKEPARQYKNTSLYLIANFKPAKASNAKVQLTDLKTIVDYYREKMDYIIMDSSPMALVADTEVMADMVDVSVLVVREDVVLAQHINDAIDVLNKNNADVLGCIFSDATRKHASASPSYGGYGGYYGRRK